MGSRMLMVGGIRLLRANGRESHRDRAGGLKGPLSSRNLGGSAVGWEQLRFATAATFDGTAGQ